MFGDGYSNITKTRGKGRQYWVLKDRNVEVNTDTPW